MPIYEYTCGSCGKAQDFLQKVDDPAPPKCDACGAEGTMSRQVSRTSFVLKGGGWYSDLYSSTNKTKGSDSSGSGSGGSSES
jgi:putative FmdB family regulatory protein